MTSDWKEVYRQELKRPGYVIEDGRLPRERQQEAPLERTVIVGAIRLGPGGGDPILWAKPPWTGRAVMRTRCQNEPRG